VQRIFDRQNVILTKITETDLESFLVDSDIDDNGNSFFRFNEFADAIIETVPEYVFAQYSDPNIPQTNIVSRVRESAKSVYKIKEYDLMRKACLNNDATAQSELDKLPLRTLLSKPFQSMCLHNIVTQTFHKQM